MQTDIDSTLVLLIPNKSLKYKVILNILDFIANKNQACYSILLIRGEKKEQQRKKSCFHMEVYGPAHYLAKQI